MHYGPDYQEDVELPDATEGRLRLRMIRPDDKSRLQQALMRLSPESQYLRFFTAKARLTSSELAYLTELDGHDHLAIGAVRLAEDGSEGEGVAVARYVRLRDEPEVAEPAIVVSDDMQHRGIGSMMMKRLIEAAREQGVRTFRTEFLAQNVGMRELLEGVSSSTRFTEDGSVVVAEFSLDPVTDVAVAEPGSATTMPVDVVTSLTRLLKLVVKQGLQLRRQFEMLFDPESLRQSWEKFRREVAGRLGGGES